MKKYTLFLFLLIFSFGLFVFGLNSAKVQASGAPISQAFSCTGSPSFGAGSIVCSGSDQGLTQDTSWGLYPSCSNIYLGTVKCSVTCDTSKGYRYSGGACEVDPSWVNPALPPATPAALPIPTLSGPSTAKVGDIINFSVSVANQMSGCPTILTGTESAACNRNIAFIANPFYLRPTGNFGEFKVINPGTLTVIAQMGLVGQINSSKTITLTGVGPVSTKGVKITTSKDLTGVMFDSLRTNCDKRSLNGCVYQYTSGNARRGLVVVDDSNSPALYSAVNNMGITTTSGSTQSSGPVYYSIDDPFNPVINSANSYPAAYFDKGSGQYIHAYPEVYKVIYSNDGAFSTVANSEGPKFLFEGSKRYNPSSLAGVLDRSIDAFLVQFSGYTIAINDSGSQNASNLTNLSGTCSQEWRGGTLDVCANGNGTLNPITTPLPPLFPAMNAGTRIPLGNQQFVASFEAGGTCGSDLSAVCPSTTKKLVIYNLMSKTPSATLNLPNTFGPSQQGLMQVAEKKIGDIDYIYVTNGKYVSQSVSSILLSVYKYEYSTKKLTTVMEASNLGNEYASSIAGVNINNAPGVAVFSAAISSAGASSPDSHGYLRVYMNSDLANGKVIDVLGGTGANIIAPSTNTSAGSYTKGNSSYLYYYDVWNNDRTYVFQLDSTSGSSSATPPVSSDDCAPGDLYSRFTGQRCVADNSGIVTYNVNTSPGIGGTISPSYRTVVSGLTAFFSINPNTKYLISSVSGCNGTLSGNTYITEPITGACTVSASFSPSSTDCAPGDLFSRSTGKRCSSLDCALGDLFSTITGKACNSN